MLLAVLCLFQRLLGFDRDTACEESRGTTALEWLVQRHILHLRRAVFVPSLRRVERRVLSNF